MLIRAITAIFLTFVALSATAEQLPYGIRDDVRRQTQNMAEIERELGQVSAQVQAGPSAQQQALLAQFQSMLNANPQLKAQFEAASPEEQSAFMAQMGIATGAGSGQMNAYGWLEQRLDSVQQVLNRAPPDHPDIVALQQRVTAARNTVASSESAEEANTQAALATNDLSEYPNFETDLATAEGMATEIAYALPLLQRMSSAQSDQPGLETVWLLTNQISSTELRRVQQTIDNADGYLRQIQKWDQQYQPLLNESAAFKNKWYVNLQYMPQLLAKLNADAPAAMSVMLLCLQHNERVVNQMVNDATARRAVAYFDGGIAQAQREVATLEALYPLKAVSAAPTKAQLTTIQNNIANSIAAGLVALEDLIVAERRMPTDAYDGEDANTLKQKAQALVEEQFPGQEIMELAICCEWDTEDYEELVERVPGEWVRQRFHFRDIQIGVLMPLNSERLVIRVVGVRQNFVTDREIVELLRELPMLRESL